MKYLVILIRVTMVLSAALIHVWCTVWYGIVRAAGVSGDVPAQLMVANLAVAFGICWVAGYLVEKPADRDSEK